MRNTPGPSDFHWPELLIVLAIIAILAALVFLQGCGSTTDRQMKTVETEKFLIPALSLDTMAGSITTQPAIVYRQREATEVETTRKVIDVPDIVTPVMAAAGGTPWGAIISAVAGLGVAAFTGKKAIDNARQRDEVIDGNERSKETLSAIQAGNHPVTGKPMTAWDLHTAALEAEQSKDTVAAVKRRVG